MRQEGAYDASDPERNEQLALRAKAAAYGQMWKAQAPLETPEQRLRNAMDSIRLKRGAGEYTDQEAARAAVLAEQEAAASQMPAGQAGAYDVDSAQGYAELMGLQNAAQFRKAAYGGISDIELQMLPANIQALISGERGFQKQPIAFDNRQ